MVKEKAIPMAVSSNFCSIRWLFVRHKRCVYFPGIVFLKVVVILFFFVTNALALPKRDLLITQVNGQILRLTTNDSLLVFADLQASVSPLDGLVFDYNGNLYVSSDHFPYAILRFSAANVLYRLRTGAAGTPPDTFVRLSGEPKFLAVDQAGYLYVSLYTGGTTGVFKYLLLDPTVKDSTDPGVLSSPLGVAVDPQGNVYVAHDFNKIIKFAGGNLHDTLTIAVLPGGGRITGVDYDPSRNALIANVLSTGVIWAVPLASGSPYVFDSTHLSANDGIAISANKSIFIVNESSPYSVLEFVGSDSTNVRTYQFSVDPDEIVEIPDTAGLFTHKQDYTVGSSPVSIAAADLDGDEHIDLAVANAGSNTLSILHNNGDGSFTVNNPIGMGGQPHSVVAADLNGDGYLDLIVANADSNSISILINNKDGTFAPRVDIPAGNHPYSVIAADLDGDGDVDLVATLAYDDNVSVFKNNGNGMFAARTSYGTGITPTYVCAADFEGNGPPDLAVTNSGSNTLSIYKNNGDGTFTFARSYGTGPQPHQIYAANLNDDRYPDLVVGPINANYVSVYLNNKDGTFLTPPQNYPVGSSPHIFCVADVDGNGGLDLVVPNEFSNTVSVLQNDRFGHFNVKTDYPTGAHPFATAGADFDGDGDIDFAVTNRDDNTVSIFENLTNIPAAPDPPTISAILDAGTGDKLVVKWSAPLNTSNLTNYEVGWGPDTNNYADSIIVPADGHSSYRAVIDNLQSHAPYFVAVRSRNANTGLTSTWAWAHNPDTAVYATIPVILVHGICPGGPDIWDDPNSTEDYKRWFEVANFNHIWIVDNLACCGWAGEQHYDSNAVRLSGYIEARAREIESKTKGAMDSIRIDSIDVIAHSMGGLIVRRYISDDDPPSIRWAHLRKVRNLVMFGTPNLGTNLGDRARDCGLLTSLFTCPGPAPRELGQKNMIDFNSKYYKRRGARFYVASGTGGRVGDGCSSKIRTCSKKLEVSRQFEWCPNDGIVWRLSAEIALLDGKKEDLWCHNEYYADAFLFISFVKPILLGQPVTQQISYSTDKVESFGSTPQIAVTRCGTAQPSQQWSELITVEGGGMSIMLLATDPSLGFTLESPGGIIWDSIRAESDPAVLYSSSLDGKGYVFENAEPGTWVIHYNWQNSNSFSALSDQTSYTSINYSLLIAFQNSVNFQAAINETYPLPGSSIVLTASITDNSAPITGAAVTALPIHAERDTLPLINLFDDGNHYDGGASDGVYGGIFNQPTDSGLITFEVVAAGSGSSVGQFRREANLLVYVTLGVPMCGDLNRDRLLSPADVVLELNCVFLNPGQCFPGTADVNNDGVFTPADVVIELNAVFLGISPRCPVQ